MKKPHILVVDDDIALSNTIIYFIEKRGYTAVATANAEEAFEKTKETTFDAIITDVQMPGGSGIDLLQMLSHLKVVPPTYVHSSEAYFYFNQERLDLATHISNFYSKNASFMLKDDHTLKNIQSFLESITPTK